MERKWTDRQYHVQDNADFELEDVKIYCNTNQFPELYFSGPYYKPHGARGLSKHYHLRFDPKLVMGTSEILCITCACVACKSMLYKPCISGIPSDKQELYKPIAKCPYWPVIRSFKNWIMFQLLKDPNNGQ